MHNNKYKVDTMKYVIWAKKNERRKKKEKKRKKNTFPLTVKKKHVK